MKLRYYLSGDREVKEVSINTFQEFELFLKELGAGGISERQYRDSLKYWSELYQFLQSDDFSPRNIALPNRIKADRYNHALTIIERIK